MFAQFSKAVFLTKGEKAFVLAYGVVIAMTAGITILVMSDVNGPKAIPDDPSFYVFWIIFAGALSGGIALFVARGWMGRSGALGLARAVVGSIAIAVVAAVIAGSLIFPLYGTFYAPILLVSAFIAKPWLAVAWFVVLLGAHYLMCVMHAEKASGFGRDQDQRATSQLSRLSQAQLYRRPVE